MLLYINLIFNTQYKKHIERTWGRYILFSNPIPKHLYFSKLVNLFSVDLIKLGKVYIDILDLR
jgi:hypothetical protein